MRKIFVVIIALALVACSRSGDTTFDEPTEPLAETIQVTDERVAEVIERITELECEMRVLTSNMMSGEADGAANDRIVNLREERFTLVEEIFAMSNDSTFLAAVQQQLNTLRSEEGYCAALADIPLKQQPPAGERTALNMSADARKVAEINCRLKDVHQKLEGASGNPQIRKELDALQAEKKTLIKQLSLLYGQALLADRNFREKVNEEQEALCNYVTELKAVGRVPQPF